MDNERKRRAKVGATAMALIMSLGLGMIVGGLGSSWIVAFGTVLLATPLIVYVMLLLVATILMIEKD